MDRKRDDSEQDETANAIGAGAQSTDVNVTKPVSGMPFGGPHDLGEKSAEKPQESIDQP